MNSKNNSDFKPDSFRINKKLITFFICVFVSLLFWLLMELSKEYTILQIYPVSYINFPTDKVMANKLPENIVVEIKSTGFNLVINKFKQLEDTVIIDVSKQQHLPSKNHFYIVTNLQLDNIDAKFSPLIEVVKVNPDTINFNYNKKITKQVFVKTNLKLNFEEQFQLVDEITVIPKTITIAGAADFVNAIDTVNTVFESLVKLNKPISLLLKIDKVIENRQIEINPSKVKVILNVAKYTEGNVELPIEIKNLPLGFNLKTFPDKVNVKYNVAFTDFEKISPFQFRAVVDYINIEKETNKLKVVLIKQPKEVRDVKCNLEKVEFILTNH